MKLSARAKRRLVTAFFCLAIAGSAIAQRHALVRAALGTAAAAVLHVRVEYDAATFGTTRTQVRGLRIGAPDGEPIAQAARVDVTYDLRDALMGGSRAFGLHSFDVENPHLRIVRHRDGTYNVPRVEFGKGGSGGAPFIVTGRIANGSVDVVDEGNVDPHQRRLYVRNANANVDVATAAASHYEVAFDYGERPEHLYAVRGRGDLDGRDGFADHHWTARELPLAGAVDFVVNSPSLHVASGVLRDVDVRAIGTHIAAGAQLEGGRIAIGGLSKPVENVHGRIDVYGDGGLANGVRASIAGVPVRVDGGIANLAHPQFRIAVRGRGDLARLRTAFVQTARLPIRGPLTFALLVEGPISQPLTWISLDSPGVAFRGQRVEHTQALVAFDGINAGIVNFETQRGGAQLAIRGNASIQPQPQAISAVVDVRGPSDAIPLATTALANMSLHATALATASDPKAVDVRGYVSGASPSQTLAGAFDVDSRGTGTIGPVWIGNRTGSLYARIALNHPGSASSGYADAHNYTLPGRRGTIDGIAFGEEAGRALAVVADTHARGPWGAMDAPVRALYSGGHAVVQLPGVRFSHAAAFGIPIDAFDATLEAGPQSVRVASAQARVAGGTAIVSGSNAPGHSIAVSARDVAFAGARASLGATVSGSPSAPNVASSLIVDGARVRGFGTSGIAGLSLTHGELALHDAQFQAGPAFASLDGRLGTASVDRGFTPDYDLDARLQTADAATLLAAAQPALAPLVQGSFDVAGRVRGTGYSPSFAGTFDSAELSVNGLALRDVHASAAGNPSGASFENGRMTAGSTAIAFGGSVAPGAIALAANAPHADLADFNDAFDTGDTFGGTGSVAIDASIVGGQIVSTNGNVRVANARFRRIELGNTTARWHANGNDVDGTLAFGGETGTVNATIARNANGLQLAATAHRLDLATWLPMLGYDLPVTGKLDAVAHARGTYANRIGDVRAGVIDGTAGRFAIRRFALDAAVTGERGTLRSAIVELPNFTTVASGTFGLRSNDRFTLVARSTSDDVGTLARNVTGRAIDVSGLLDSTLRADGTLDDPRIVDDFTLTSLRSGALAASRVSGELVANRTRGELRNGEIDLQPGQVLISAAMPLSANGPTVGAGRGPISATLTARDVDASNLTGLFPKGTHVAGRIDGSITASGTLAAPRLEGSLALTKGAFIGPQERAPIKGVHATVAFHGTTATLEDLHGDVGGGSVAANGFATLARGTNLHGLTFALHGRAQNAHLEMPAYFQGNLDAGVTLAKNAGESAATASGNVAVSSARVPLSAFYNPRAKAGAAPELPPIAFHDFRFSAGRDVRVQSTEVDIAGTGAARLDGTLAAPVLTGAFRATGGTIDFYHTFALRRAEIAFDRWSGLMPRVDAVATTFLHDPPTDIRLHVSGPADDLNLALASDPSYDREQILGLLVGAQSLGAVRGVASSGSASGGFSLPGAARNVALGNANTVFVRHLLEPLSTSLGSALGFSDLQITNDLQSGLGLGAVKAFGKDVDAIFGEAFGYPRTQAVTLEARPSIATTLQLRAYSSQGPTLLSLQQPQPAGLDVLELNPMTAMPPSGGSNGVGFSFVRRLPP